MRSWIGVSLAEHYIRMIMLTDYKIDVSSTYGEPLQITSI